MDRQFTSVEILSRENNELAIDNAIEVLKARLGQAPEFVLNDVLNRCDPEIHDTLIDWLADRAKPARKNRLPRSWSPKRNRKLWILYAAADLDRPEQPPKAA